MNLEELKKRQEKIRNFSIIAILTMGSQRLQTVFWRQLRRFLVVKCKPNFWIVWILSVSVGLPLNSMSIELNYTAKDGETYIFHLIDTPGHVDFTYEVSTFARCLWRGDFSSWRCTRNEAQTLANVYLALDNDLEILPVINKIDLPAADPERVRTEIEDVIGLDA